MKCPNFLLSDFTSNATLVIVTYTFCIIFDIVHWCSITQRLIMGIQMSSPIKIIAIFYASVLWFDLGPIWSVRLLTDLF